MRGTRCSRLGMIALGLCAGVAPVWSAAYGLAPDNGYLVEVGVQHTSENWSSDIKHNSSGSHLLVGHGLHERCMVYWEVFAEIPVINRGVERSSNPDEKTDVSPNTYIFGAGVGIRGIPWKNDRWTVLLEARYSSLSEFDDFAQWGPGEYSDIHVDEITELGSSLLLIRKFGALEALVGLDVSSTFAHGEVIHKVAGQPDSFVEFDERDKVAIKGMLGLTYAVGEKWNLLAVGETGDGYGGRIGFYRLF